MTRLSRGLVVGPLTKALLAVTIVFSAPIGCRWADLPGLGRETRPNVLLILVDTLRADSLGTYGYSRNTSPELDAFAESSILFESARSQATCTFPSVNSMLTSRYPQVFLGGDEFGMPDEIPYLPEILKEHGYATIAVSASPVVTRVPSRGSGGYGRGFDYFKERRWGNARVLNDVALKVLEERAREESSEVPVFLYLHYMEPHDPYSAPGEFGRRFAKPYEGEDFVARGDPNPIFHMIRNEEIEFTATPRDLQHLRDLYDGEIAFFDTAFRELLDRLSASGFLENALVLVVSDHGEEFLEHQHVKHCLSVYETLTHVPFILKTPSGKARGRRDTVVQNLDIVPTVLDYVGIQLAEPGFQGRSLRPVIEQDDEGHHPYSYCVQYNWRSVNDERHKLILDLTTGAAAFYDLQRDPEERNGSAIDSPDAAGLASTLEAWMMSEEPGLTREQRLDLSKESVEKLEELGYFQ